MTSQRTRRTVQTNPFVHIYYHNMYKFRPFNLDISNWDENSFVNWYHVTNDGWTQLDGRPHGDALVKLLLTFWILV